MAAWLMSLNRNHQVRGSVPRLGIVVGAISPSTGSQSNLREISAVGTSNLPSLLVGSLLALLGNLERLFTSSDFLFNVCVSHDYSFN